LAFLNDLAERNGGMHLVVRNESEMNAAAVNIGLAMRNQYVIGYRPTGTDHSGKWRAIHVKLGVPETRVHARHGYYWR
jgi:Ca-activated chloride channel family protein